MNEVSEEVKALAESFFEQNEDGEFRWNIEEWSIIENGNVYTYNIIDTKNSIKLSIRKEFKSSGNTRIYCNNLSWINYHESFFLGDEFEKFKNLLYKKRKEDRQRESNRERNLKKFRDLYM